MHKRQVQQLQFNLVYLHTVDIAHSCHSFILCMPSKLKDHNIISLWTCVILNSSYRILSRYQLAEFEVIFTFPDESHLSVCFEETFVNCVLCSSVYLGTFVQKQWRKLQPWFRPSRYLFFNQYMDCNLFLFVRLNVL